MSTDPRRSRTLRLAVTASLVLAVARADASTVLEMGVEDLVGCADVIARGSIVSAEPSLGADGHVATRLHLVVRESFLDSSVGALVDVWQPGGSLGTRTTIVPGATTLAVGDEVFAFLEPRPEGGFRILGLWQGADLLASREAGILATRAGGEHGEGIVHRDVRLRAPSACPLEVLEGAVRALVEDRRSGRGPAFALRGGAR